MKKYNEEDDSIVEFFLKPYLEKIEEGYQNFQEEHWSTPFNRIDLNNLDFIDDERAYQILLHRIKAF